MMALGATGFRKSLKEVMENCQLMAIKQAGLDVTPGSGSP